MAVEGGHDAVAQLLAEEGVDLAARDRFGRTAMQLANGYGYKAIARRLGATLSAEDDGEVTTRPAVPRRVLKKCQEYS